MASEHTPLPWAKHPTGVATVYSPGAKNRIVAGCGSWTDNTRDVISEQEANAQLIIMAVNSHDALVAALRDIREHTDPEPASENYRADDREGCLDTVFSVATAALRAAGELEGRNE
jgi:hypothetical protein